MRSRKIRYLGMSLLVGLLVVGPIMGCGFGGNGTVPPVASPSSSAMWTPTAANWQCPSPPAATFVGSYNPATGWAGVCTLASGEVCSGSAAPTGFAGTCVGGSGAGTNPGAGPTTSPTPTISIQITITTSPAPVGQCGAFVGIVTTNIGACPSASSPAPASSSASPGVSSTSMAVHATFYGKDDAPNNAAYTQLPPGGDGSYATPLTMAGDPSWTWLPKGAIVYSKALQRYFINNDECQGCRGTSNPPTVDFWVGSSTGDGPCASRLMVVNVPTQATGTTPIILNPASTLPTIAGAMWNGTTCNIPVGPYPTS